MNLFKFFIVFFNIGLILSCATPYKQAKSPVGYGYYDNALQQDMYQINFNGNEFTDRIVAYDYCLLRAAEVCIQNGYKTFDIIKSDDKSQTTFGSMYSYYNNSTTTLSTEPKEVLIIICSKEKKFFFVAEEIILNLRKKYYIFSEK